MLANGTWFLVLCILQSPAAQVASPPSDWTRVIGLKSGGEIVVAADNRTAFRGYFVRAEESSLTVLSLESGPVAQAIRRLLRASFKPDDIAATLEGRELVTESKVRIGPSGLFIDGQRVADLDQVVRQLPRTQVREVAGRMNRPGRRAAGIALIVAGSGMTIGNLVGLSSGTPSSAVGQDGYLGWGGVAVGGGLVFLGGFLIHKAQASGLIYRAPRQ